MKLIKYSYVLLLALAGTPLMAAPAMPTCTVQVCSNTISIAYSGVYPKDARVMLGGEALAWHQLGKSNIVATLPANLPGGSYSLVLRGQAPMNLTIGVQGPKGDTGAQGLPGPAGPQGIQGPQGETGAQGIQGESGAPGANGTNGSDGINGTNGVDGINGTNGVNGVDGGLVSNFVHAYAVGVQEVLTNSPITFTALVVSSATDWGTNTTSAIIPVTGTYQISFMINADGADLTNAAPEVIALDIVDSPNAFNQGGVDQGYFQFNGSQTGALSGQLIEQCTAGDSISLNNVSSGNFSIGNLLPPNVPSATVTIMQIK
jgi:hypothetical protein